MGIGLPFEGEGESNKKILFLHSGLAGHDPSVRNCCILTMEGVVLLTFISFKQRGRIVVLGEGMRSLLNG